MSNAESIFQIEERERNKAKENCAEHIHEIYLLGSKVFQKDPVVAIKLYTLAAEQGHAVAQYNLGVENFDGNYIPQSFDQAVRWWTLSAEQNNSQSQRSLASLYIYGIGVERDIELGISLLKSSAKQNHPKAQLLLAKLFLMGDIVKRDINEGIKWLRSASELGEEEASTMLNSIDTNDVHVSKTQERLSQDLSRLNITPLLITHAGNVFFVSQFLKEKPINWTSKECFEVMITIPEEKLPYFIYYKCDNFYNLLINNQRVSVSSNANKQIESAKEFSAVASKILAVYLLLKLYEKTSNSKYLSLAPDFDHNRKETNIIAYLSNFEQWYPLFYSKTETEDDLYQKLYDIDSGEIDILDYIAIDSPSP